MAAPSRVLLAIQAQRRAATIAVDPQNGRILILSNGLRDGDYLLFAILVFLCVQ